MKRSRIDPTGSLTPITPNHITAHNWRHIRARAHHIAQEHRRYLNTYGRLPHCPLHMLETEPLWSYLRATESEPDEAWNDTATGDLRQLTSDYIGRRIGMSRSLVVKIKARGYLSRDAAERIAHELGEHPLRIWPDYLFDLGDDEEAAA